MEACFEKMTPQWLNRAHVFTGSIGPAFTSFNYRLEMDEESRTVHAAAYSKLCYEKAEDVEKELFNWDEPGVEELKNWLQSRYEAYLAREGKDACAG